jgi:hypothetical protein
MEANMTVFFNNCNGRDHVKLYGKGAFYDLGTKGFQSTQATNLQPGQECVVASRDGPDIIVFKWYRFSKEVVKLDDQGILYRVFIGDIIESKTDRFPQSVAAKKKPYSIFFDVNGNFKRRSTI